MSIFNRLKKGLSKSRQNLSDGLTSAFKRHPKIDDLFHRVPGTNQIQSKLQKE